MKHRLDRVNEVIKRELSDQLRREFTFSAKLVTIQQVDVTPDLKQAHVYVGVIGSPAESREAMAQLHDKRTALQHDLAKRVVIKFTPQLHFHLDDTMERGGRILSILEELQLPEDLTTEEEPEEGDDSASAQR
jgi:ribosome-binding factor A